MWWWSHLNDMFYIRNIPQSIRYNPMFVNSSPSAYLRNKKSHIREIEAGEKSVRFTR